MTKQLLKKRTRSMHIDGMLYYDKMYGNTYHSARVSVDGKLVAVVPMQYDYGCQYRTSVAKVLGFETEYKMMEFCQENNITVYDTAYPGKKRDVQAHGEM